MQKTPESTTQEALPIVAPAPLPEPEALPIPAAASAPNAPAPSLFASLDSFENGQRIARALSASDLVPAQYRGNIPNVLIALEIARHTGCSPFFVMQNLHVIQGRPSWSAQAIIAFLNACGRFRGGLRFETDSEQNPQTCRAWAIESATGERVNGPTVSLEMARKEGWANRTDKTGRNTSKWQSMPEVMLRYRAASFFGRQYAPDLLLGMYSVEEALEIAPSAHLNGEAALAPESGVDKVNQLLSADAAAA